MIYYTLFYLVLNALIAFDKIVKGKAGLYALLVVSFLFSALRYDAGYDYFNYLGLILYETGFAIERVEYFNRLIISISRELNFPQFFFIVSSLLYVLFMAKGLMENKALNALSVSIFLLYVGCYLASFDIIRQMVAAAIIFYGATVFFKKKYMLGCACYLFGMGFHKSSIIFFFIIAVAFLFRKKQNLLCYVLILIASSLSTQLLVNMLERFGFYYHYIEAGGSETGGKIYLLVLLSLLMLYFLARVVRVESEAFWRAFNLFFVGVALYTALIPFGYFVTRITYYFFPWFAVAFGLLYQESAVNKRVVFVSGYTLSSMTFFAMLYVSMGDPRNPLLNYSFYFMD